MRLKQKFALLAVGCGLLMAIISIVGLVSSNNTVEESVEAELVAVVQAEKGEIGEWVEGRKSMSKAAGQVVTSAGGSHEAVMTRSNLAMGGDDPTILGMIAAHKDGALMSFKDGDITGVIDATTRPWYKKAAGEKNTFVTEAYEDAITHTLVISCITPFFGEGGFTGAICEDVQIARVKEMVEDFKYRGSGVGYIIEQGGVIIGANDDTAPMETVDKKHWGKHFAEMVKNGEGFFVDGDDVIAYSTLDSTGWIATVVVSNDVVFAPVTSLRTKFIIVSIIGILLILGACMMFGNQLQSVAASLKFAIEGMAAGNLNAHHVDATSGDELGDMANSFNRMQDQLRNTIKKIADTASKVANASEELTANASQSADASVNVAETVGEVANGTDSQLMDIDSAKHNVDAVYNDINNMAKKAEQVAEATTSTAEAAEKGESLMEDAVAKMNNIEQSVTQSAAVVAQLGEKSQQIGEIVDAITAISEQTNLLALNAAIEAARAGEAGRGFAVVAEEVRKLAEQSQESAEEIRTRIGGIQTETEKAVKTMETGTKDVKEGIEAIRNVGEQFRNIMDKVGSISEEMKEIDISVATVSNGANSIVEAVESIDKVSRDTSRQIQTISAATEEQSASNEEIAAAAHSLSELAEELNTEARKFKY
ncbi:methyl-accepting chemotaxis protein [Anaerovibrio sp.]|uniref:methyl-accepting chemotaxis protein n=1 Tax=Anaerovibrio sp. TaxID=1872532 RepID=UPI00388DBCDE